MSLRQIRLEQTKGRWDNEISFYKKSLLLENSETVKAHDSIANERKT